MQKLFYRWLLSIGMFGLILMLAACGGGSSSTTTGSNANGGSSPATSNSNSTTPASTGTSTFNFTASGGLSGNYMVTIPIESNSNTLITSSKNKTFKLIAQNDVLNISIDVLPYTGPGSYTLSNKYFPDISQDETISVQSGLKVWGGYKQLSPTWTCPLTIASDTASTINVGGDSLAIHEIKGSFSCSMVLSALNNDPPLNISNGQFDVFVPHLEQQNP